MIIKLNIDWKKFQNHRQREILIKYNEKIIYRIIIISNNIYRFFNVEWLNNKRFHSATKSSTQASRNQIDIFLDNLNMKFRNDNHCIDVISRLIQTQSQKVFQNNAFVIFDTFDFENDLERLRKQRQFAFSFFILKNSIRSFFTSFDDDVDKLIINIFNFAQFEIVNTVNQLEKTLKQHFYLRFRRDFSMNFLTLLTQYVFSNFHEFKIYNETMTNVQHKMNWQLDMNDEMQFHKNNDIWKFVFFVFQNRKFFFDKWIYKTKKNQWWNDQI